MIRKMGFLKNIYSFIYFREIERMCKQVGKGVEGEGGGEGKNLKQTPR